MRNQRFPAFTLSELLIALAILGVIATFTIPKVLQSQRNTAWKAGLKETASSISAAYQAYKLSNTVDENFSGHLLTPYLNYVGIDSTKSLDFAVGSGNWECSWNACLKLHNGAYLWYQGGWEQFGGTTSTNVIRFVFDPDGKRSGDTYENASVFLYLTYDGRIIDGGQPQAQAGAYYTKVGGALTQNWGNPTVGWFDWN